MTSEIAILNSEGVALASDSAVTINQGIKIYNSANKLFCLSKFKPVGIMIYGNASFMKTPFETIIKVFREKLSDKSYPKLEDYADEFIKFLNKNEIGISNSQQTSYRDFFIRNIFNEIKNNIVESCDDLIKKKGKITKKEINKISLLIINQFKENFSENKKLECYSDKFLLKFKKSVKSIINKSIKNIFQNLPLSKKEINYLEEIIISIFTKDNFPPWESGIVIAGFGEKEIFPSLVSYEIEALINNELKFKKGLRRDKIGFTKKASIIPFAQSEMVHTFMQGVDPNYKETTLSYLENVFSKYPDILIDNLKDFSHLTKRDKKNIKRKLKKISLDMFKEYDKKMSNFSRKNHIDKVLDVVAVLPKDELAAMAESLVNLTSFKRRVSMSQETVGGPIDVAVISKGDGFIWIKRKHYFKPELNHHFFKNYFKIMEVNNEKE